MRRLLSLVLMVCTLNSAVAAGPCLLYLFNNTGSAITFMRFDGKTVIWQNDPHYQTKHQFQSNTVCLADEIVRAEFNNQKFVSKKRYRNNTDASGHVALLNFPRDFKPD